MFRSIPKKDFIRRLLLDLERANVEVPISMSNSGDPYPPEEAKYKLTRKTLEILLPKGYKVLIVTKGALVVRDLDLLSKGNAAVTMTITTMDRGLAGKLEPKASMPQDRVRALEKLVENGVPVGVRVDPIIPYINDDEVMIRDVIETLASIGVKFIVTSTFKARPDSLKRVMAAFPEIAEKLRRLYRDEGIWTHGYWYLPVKHRKTLLEPVIKYARKFKMEYATCREGFTSKEWFNTRSCDGTHLIPYRVKCGLNVN